MGGTWEGIDLPTGELGPANQSEFFPTKGLYYGLNTSQLSRWLVSDEPAGEEAGCGGPGCEWLHVVCGCEACWTYCQILLNDVGGILW
jgi:hypothetical protein